MKTGENTDKKAVKWGAS